MKKKLIKGLLFLFLLLFVKDVPVLASSNTDIVKNNEYDSSYLIKDGFVISNRTLVEYIGDETQILTMPWEIVNIGYSAFENNKKLTKVIIPEGVESIGGYAFKGCSKLKEVSIPDSVKVLGGSAFSHCTKLEEVKLPDQIKKIGLSTFFKCTSLKSVKLPKALTEIETYAFRNCESLQELEMPNQRIKLGSYVFYNCRSLKRITVPKDFKTIACNYIFATCHNLVIYGGADTEIEAYAKRRGIPFVVQNTVSGIDKNNIQRVSFEENGGTNISFHSKAAILGKTYGALPTVGRAGYEFKGWYSSKSGGTKITASTKVKSQDVKVFYARWSKVAKPGKTSVSLKRSKTTALTVKIKRVKDAKGYEILYSTNKNFKSAKKVTTASLTKTIKGLKAKNTYFVKVRAYKIDSAGKKVYGGYSSPKNVKGGV